MKFLPITYRPRLCGLTRNQPIAASRMAAVDCSLVTQSSVHWAVSPSIIGPPRQCVCRTANAWFNAYRRKSSSCQLGRHHLPYSRTRSQPNQAVLVCVGPTHRRVPQPGRTRNRQGASQAGSCQTANDGSDKSGMGVPRSIETRNKTHACMALRWNETKKNTVLRIRMGRDQGRGRCLVALA